MPTRKTDRIIQTHHSRNLVRFGIPFVVALGLGAYACQQGERGWFVAAFLVAAIIGLVGLFRQGNLFTNYRCPDCGGPLPRQPLKEDEKIEFYCSKCDVLWDTGCKHASD
jgi:hypothetical protein